MRNSFLKASALTTVLTFSTMAFAPAFGGERGGRGGPNGPGGPGGNGPDNVQVINGGQGGAGGQGGSSNSNSNAQTGASSSGGNYFGNETNIRAGAITGAPWMGGQFPAGECNSAFGISFGGGAPFVGSGGIGLQWIDVAGVALPNGYLVSDYIDAEPKKRVEISEDLSKGDREKLTCISNAWRRHVITTSAQERMNDKRGEADITIAAINALRDVKVATVQASADSAKYGLTHGCTLGAVVLKKDEKLDPRTIQIRPPRLGKDVSEFGHQDCGGITKTLVDEGILNSKSFLADLDSLVHKKQQQTNVPAQEGVPVLGK